ncbi:MAG: WD40 repeat domain-containing protein, partial [Leptolyngbya sp. SIO1D8]|nr:WD40 repeat domain-containing protein [Leptolyngbya sp. SIO1D8]
VLADLAPAGILASPAVPAPLAPLTTQPWHCVQTWPTPGRIINALAISPDSRAIATGSNDHAVQLWDQQTGEVLQTFAQRLGFGNGHTDAVTTVQFSPDGHHLLTGSDDSTIKQWDLAPYRLRRTLQQTGWPITTISLTPDGQTLITAAVNGRLTIWDLPLGKPVFDLVRHQGAVNAIALSPNGTRLASVGKGGTLRLWTLPEGQLLHTWTLDNDYPCAVVFDVSPNGNNAALITGSAKGQVTAWSLTDFQQQDTFGQHQDEVSAIALSPDRRLVATGSRDREIHLWDVSTAKKCRLAVLRHDWAVRDLIFTPDSCTLISSAGDETIRFWQAMT